MRWGVALAGRGRSSGTDRVVLIISQSRSLHNVTPHPKLGLLRLDSLARICYDSHMSNSPYAAAEAHLITADPVLARLIAAHGPCTLAPDLRYFHTLVDSIISQQISVKAAASILRRFQALLPDGAVTPEAILALPVEQMREAG